jgi:hypothetical protein
LKSIFRTIGKREIVWIFQNDLFRNKDRDGDGSVEKSEFDEARKTNKNLNQTLIDILEKKFQQDANNKITYERMYFIIVKPRFISVVLEFVEDVNEYYNNRNWNWGHIIINSKRTLLLLAFNKK